MPDPAPGRRPARTAVIPLVFGRSRSFPDRVENEWLPLQTTVEAHWTPSHQGTSRLPVQCEGESPQQPWL